MARKTTLRDVSGKESTVWVPEGVPDSFAAFGATIGPPSLASLGLPEEIEKRLQNQLNARGVLTYTDFRKKRTEVLAALMAAYQVDAQRLEVLYKEADGK